MIENALHSPPFRKLKPLLAASFSFLFNGLGQLYNGEFRKGALFFTIPYFALFLLAQSGMQYHFIGLFVIIAFLICYSLFVAIEAFLRAKKIKQIPRHFLTHPFILIALVLIKLIIFLPL